MIITLSIIFIILSTSLTKLFRALAQNTILMDKPNERSLHSIPTVRGGGIVFIGLSLLSLPLLCYLTSVSIVEQLGLMVAIILLAMVSFIDDLYQLSTKFRFLIQAMVALIILMFMRPESLDFVLFSLNSPFLIIPFLFLAVIWAINHFNFMDGMDGFCALQAVFLFTSYALLFHFNQAWVYQDFCGVLVSCLIGFLIFNFPPAKLFMGDVGSATLGLITFALAIIGQQKYQIPIIYWFLLNGLFLFDSTITLIRRILNQEKWSAAHRKHAYQRLKQSGVSTGIILLGQALINGLILVGLMAVYFNKLSIGLILVSCFALILIVYLAIERRFPMPKERLPAPISVLR